ncbi:metallophosphoesterase [Rhodococcus spongiicola]|uniref:Twin-arginine translocation signal domain-containing protein n=1 Tax=Rhodococcus spongiicola TaxID=2487352 RepID=A0A438AX52_9NOCA|nr:metallophosphoesterase [Rhodococcus spongiicola]RVW03278.1 twin-arginine translocation signal domain-containing protein [Rhodococcus spongiicola]
MTELNQINRRRFLAGAGAAGIAVPIAAMAPASSSAAVPDAEKYAFPTADEVRVLVTGDAGTGTPAQWAVADAMRTLHRSEPFGMALGLGDNIYESGPNGDHDVQFATKFEDPNHELDFPWVMALGNHDTSLVVPGDGGWLLRGNDEVVYHGSSRRWWMPSRYYSVRVPEENPIVEFFVLDLNPVAAYLPPLFVPYWAVNGQYMNEQRAWLDNAIASSPAKWKIACTHHPYLSNGSHGDAGEYDGIPIAPMNGVYAKQFFEDHVVGRCQFLLSGHDHSLQVFEPTVASKGTRQIVSGAAGKNSYGKSSRTDRANLYQNFDDVGFMVMDLTAEAVRLRVYTVDIPTAAPTLTFDRRLA